MKLWRLGSFEDLNMSKKEMKKDNDRRSQQLFRTRTPAWSYAISAKTLTSVSVWIALIDPRKIQNSEMSDSLKEWYAGCSAFPSISKHFRNEHEAVVQAAGRRW